MSSGMGDKRVRGKMKCFLYANPLLADKTSELLMTQMTCIDQLKGRGGDVEFLGDSKGKYYPLVKKGVSTVKTLHTELHKTVQGNMKSFLCANPLLADKTSGLPMTQMTCIDWLFQGRGGDVQCLGDKTSDDFLL